MPNSSNTEAGRLTRLSCTVEDMGLSFSDVVIVLACNEYFVPYTAVAIQSIVEHMSPDRHYDIVVLTRDLSQHSIDTLVGHLPYPNMKLGFLNPEIALHGTKLPHHGHFRPETFFRLLAPWLLPNVRKAVYLDSDLVVLEDIATLFDVDVDGCLLGATRDADTVGMMLGYDGTVGPYLKNEIKLSDPMQYFQAGVLVMNLEAFRYAFTVKDMLSLSTVRVWRWLDQDILNMLADGNYVRIDMRWNTLMDWKHLRREKIIAQDPQELRDQYEAARANPAIVHFAGPDDRPWDYPDCDMGDYFWEYAHRSAFVDVLNQRLSDSQNSVAGKLDRAKVSVIFKGIMPLFDKTFPPGTKRRTRAIKSYVAIGGDLG
jgi:lipopolysaccharide biosynthesis glycosyltransferase